MREGRKDGASSDDTEEAWLFDHFGSAFRMIRAHQVMVMSIDRKIDSGLFCFCDASQDKRC